MKKIIGAYGIDMTDDTAQLEIREMKAGTVYAACSCNTCMLAEARANGCPAVLVPAGNECYILIYDASKVAVFHPF